VTYAGIGILLLYLLLTRKQGMQPLGTSWKDMIQFMVLMAGSQALAESVLEGSHLRDEGMLFAYRIAIGVGIAGSCIVLSWLLQHVKRSKACDGSPIQRV
jgi:hypothetical protein